MQNKLWAQPLAAKRIHRCGVLDSRLAECGHCLGLSAGLDMYLHIHPVFNYHEVCPGLDYNQPPRNSYRGLSLYLHGGGS